MAQACPRCGGALNIVEADGVKLDRCDACSGLFFDENEFAKIKSASINDNMAQLTKDSGVHSQRAPEDLEKKIQCLRCFNTMDRVNFAHTSGIIVDFCPVCKSLWLDGGEFEKTISFLKHDGEVSAAEAAKYDELLKNVTAGAKQNMDKGFRSISSNGKMGSIVNFVYRLVSKITD